MSRALLLDLAAQRHHVPIAADLVLHRHPDPEHILADGDLLGEVIAEAAAAFHTPLAFPLMDLRLEKVELLRFFGLSPHEAEKFHFPAAPSAAQQHEYKRSLRRTAPGPAIAAAIRSVYRTRTRTKLFPIAMCIGPYSLASKLMADPITPTYLAGSGVSAAEEPGVALLEACLELGLTCILHEVELALAAGARAVFVAEPAANQFYFSPLQLAEGSNIFERCVLAPNRRIADLVADRGAELIFHSCGELTDQMVAGFGSLRPALLSLGSSRPLPRDASLVPADTVLYGNIASKLFYSDSLMPLSRVADDTARLAAAMAVTGHPFILGTECDTLHVPEYAATIRQKVECLLTAA
ncbi:MAG TPA: uroporphyrinogen decarboxylase family protein [Lacunisphaera sp.]|jgi:uroporphyrinogen-III decarboxylase|nr:uroporphyrinogen decarboxylase family protein [Lacunisphaera sp.]